MVGIIAGRPRLGFYHPVHIMPPRPLPISSQLSTIYFLMSAPHDPYAAWRHDRFRLLTIGWFVALIGGQIPDGRFCAGRSTKRRTDNPLALAMLGLVQAIPVILLVLLAGKSSRHAGPTADHHHRAIRRGDLLGGSGDRFLTALEAITTDRSSGFICVFLSRGTALTFVRPARNALLPQTVSDGAFNNAVTWSSTIFEASCVLGPALGGLIMLPEHRGNLRTRLRRRTSVCPDASPVEPSLAAPSGGRAQGSGPN